MSTEVAWLPAQIRWTATGPLLDWCHLGDLRFTDPFFEQTVGKAMTHPFTLLFCRSTPLDVLDEPASPGLRPAGFIFHMSRCGSTLISRMPGLAIWSRADRSDSARAKPDGGPHFDRVVAWLRAMTAALGRVRHAGERDLFIKFEGWHVLLFPLIRQAFPDVPWVFVYRDPVEVMASLAQMRPAQMMPRPTTSLVLAAFPAGRRRHVARSLRRGGPRAVLQRRHRILPLWRRHPDRTHRAAGRGVHQAGRPFRSATAAELARMPDTRDRCAYPELRYVDDRAAKR